MADALLKPARYATGFLTEFRNFALKGNMIDLAVAVIIGTAFGKVVDSLVKNVFMPAIALMIGGADPTKSFSNWSYRDIHYGQFIGDLLNFVIVALAVFVAVVKVIGFLVNLRKKAAAEPAPAAVPEDVRLLTEIRDLLKQQQQNKTPLL